jgi:hypothetical protein
LWFLPCYKNPLILWRISPGALYICRAPSLVFEQASAAHGKQDSISENALSVRLPLTAFPAQVSGGSHES